MKSPKVNYFAVGAFVIAMFVAFLGALALLTGRTGAIDRYYTHYDNVMGVIPGTQILLDGYRVGQVERIAPSPEPEKGRYRVFFTVEEGWAIPDDSVAWITEPSLLAAITIDIRTGQSPTAAEPGSEIRGQDLQSVFAVVGTLAGQMEAIIEQDIRPLLDTVAAVTPEILGNLETVTSDLASATEQVAVLFDDANARQIDGMIDDFAATAENLGDLTDHLESSLQKVDEMVTRMNGLVAENAEGVDEMVDDLEHTLDSVARHVDTINANLEATTHNMNEFSEQIRRNPSVLLRGTSGGGAPDDQP
ncbi:MAG: MCE family protein [Myxococcales bacterium]|nr:MCE family protein [Myxococcales bacterium]